MQDKNVLVCSKIEFMTIAPSSNAKCEDCGAIVGITKSTEEYFKHAKNKSYVCIECFQKRKLTSEDKFMPISEGQINELADAFKKKYGGFQ